jgi:hypothetical protein
MYNQEKNITEDLAVWARPFAFHSYAEFIKIIVLMSKAGCPRGNEM